MASIERSTRVQFLGVFGMLVASGAISASALAQQAGTSVPVVPSTGDAAAASQPSAFVQRAEALARQDKLVAARSLLTRGMLAGQTAALSASDRTRAADLLDSVERRLRQLDDVEVSLQRAELSASEGDLRTAERLAQAVQTREGVSFTARTRAESVLTTVREQRSAIEPQRDALVAAVSENFASGQYARSKAAIEMIQRSGLSLSDEQRRVVEEHQVKIVDLQSAQGRILDTSAINLSMLQPGTVRTGDEPVVMAVAVNAEPGAAPAGEPAAAAPETPAATPETPAAAAAPAGADDVITQALKAETQRLMAEGDKAFEDGRIAEAARRYEMALATGRSVLAAEEIARAEARLGDTRARMGGAGDIGERAIESQRLVREKTSAEFENELSQARKELEAGNPSEARNLAARARATVNNARGSFSQAELDAFITRVDEMNSQIGAREQTMSTEAASKRAVDLDRSAAERQAAMKSEREARKRELIISIRNKQMEHRYEEALQDVDQILFMDPNDPAGRLLKDAITEVIQARRYDKAVRERRQGIQNLLIDNYEATNPPKRMMNFPANWEQKTQDRLGLAMGGESPENRRTIALLENKRLPGTFQGNSFAQVVDYLRETAGADVMVDWESLRQIGIEPTSKVNLALSEQPARVVLERVLASVTRDPSARPDYTINDGIVQVASAETIRRHTTTLVYNITDLLQAVPDFGDVPVMDLDKVLARTAAREASLAPLDEERRVRPELTRQRDREQRVSKIVQLMQDTISPDSWRDNGGDVGSIQEHNGSLIITTTPRNHQQISGLLGKLREVRSLQVNVESRFLTVAQDFFEQIGFRFNVTLNAGSNQVTAAQALDPTLRPSDLIDLSSLNPNRIVRASPGQAPPLGPVLLEPDDVNSLRALTRPPNEWSPVGIGGGSLNLAQSLFPSDGFAGNILGGAPALGIAGQFLDDVQVDFLVRATQADRRTSTLNAPRVTITNGQISNLYVVTQRALVTDLQPVVAEGSVGFDPDVTAVPYGVVMLVEAVVSADRRFVTMNIDSSINTLDNVTNISVNAVAGGALIESEETGQFIQLPTTTTTRVQTTVTVPDEGTVLLGGQRLVTEREVEVGVPLLSKMPIINRFFTNRIESKEESTLLILVKPTVIIQSEEEDKAFPGLLNQLRSGL
jgi:Flp pilus assembly secretin CpaC/tetratricopeptide (TPR) repeat protein